MKSLNKKLKKAFTLVELVVVIAIIAILSTVSVVTYFGITNSAKETIDEAVVTQLNQILLNDETLNGKPSTPSNVLEALEKDGFNLEKMTPKSNKEIVYHQDTNRFELINQIKNDDSSLDSTSHELTWRFLSTYESVGAYSIYLKDDFEGNTVDNVISGLDTGSNKNITEITYNTKDLSESKDVLIRTSSYNTTLKVNAFVDSNSNGDNIKHYGNCGTIITTSLATNSLHEFGSTAYLPLSNGRVVIENGGNVKLAYVSSENAILENNGGSFESVYALNETIKTNVENSNIEVKEEFLPANQADEKAKDVLEFAKNEEIISENELYVARIGTKGYSSFEECNKDVKENEVIYLLKDVEINSSITLNSNISQINAYKNPSAQNNSEKFYTITVNENSSLSLTTTHEVVINANIVDKNENGNINITSATTKKLIVNGDFSGEIASKLKSCYFYGIVETKTATYTNYFYGDVYFNGTEIKAGTFFKSVNCKTQDKFDSINGGSYNNIDIKTKNITAGAFNEGCKIEAELIETKTGKFTNCQVEASSIKGGTYTNCTIDSDSIVSATFDTESFISDGISNKVKAGSSTYEYNGKTYVFDHEVIAVYGTTKITSVSNLIKNLKNGNKVTLLQDIENFEQISSLTKSMELDLNGHVITTTGKFFVCGKGANLKFTVKNGTIKAPNLISGEGKAAIELSLGNYSLELENVTLEASGDYAIANSGTASNVNIKLKNCTVNGAEYGIYSPAKSSTVTIDNSTVEGTVAGVEIRRGTLDITGSSKIIGGKGEYKVESNGSGTTTYNAALAVAPYDSDQITISYDDSVVFEGTKGISIANPNNVTDPNVVVNGTKYTF